MRPTGAKNKHCTHHWVCIVSFAETSAYLTPDYDLPYGVYNIPVKVVDVAGHEGVTDVRVVVCDCTTPSDCRSRDIPPGYQPYPGYEPYPGYQPYQPEPGQAPNVSLGIWAILAMILGSLLLLCKYIYSFLCKNQHVLLMAMPCCNLFKTKLISYFIMHAYPHGNMLFIE